MRRLPGEYALSRVLRGGEAGEQPRRGKVRRVKKLIEIVDLSSGAITNRNADTLTLDVPLDLDWMTGGVSVDADRIVRYFAPGAARRLYVGRPRSLSGRVVGEECLVAVELAGREGAASLHRYSLSVVHCSDEVIPNA
jgi:hypothetical protein